MHRRPGRRPRIDRRHHRLATAGRIDTRRRGARPMLADAKIIAATFALQQALPAALNRDQAGLDDGLRRYR